MLSECCGLSCIFTKLNPPSVIGQERILSPWAPSRLSPILPQDTIETAHLCLGEVRPTPKQYPFREAVQTALRNRRCEASSRFFSARLQTGGPRRSSKKKDLTLYFKLWDTWYHSLSTGYVHHKAKYSCIMVDDCLIITSLIHKLTIALLFVCPFPCPRHRWRISAFHTCLKRNNVKTIAITMTSAQANLYDISGILLM